MNKPPLDVSLALRQEQVAAQALRQHISESDLTWAQERRYSNLFDSMRQGFALADVIRDEQGRPCGFRPLDLNEACGRLTGALPGPAKGRTAEERMPGLEPHWVEIFTKVVQTGEPARFENYVERLGKWYEVFAHRTAPEQIAFLFIDITERKRAEAAAVAQFEVAEAVFTYSIGALAVLDRQYNYLRVNEAYARACGRSVADFAGRNHFVMFQSASRPIFDDVLRTKQPATRFTRDFVFPDQPGRGVTHWEWTLVPVLDCDDEVECLVLSLKDVTEREVASNALRESEARYRQQAAELEMIYRTAPVGLCVLDTQLRYVHVNAYLAEMSGVAAEAHLGKTVREVLPQVADRIEPLLRSVLETGEPVREVELSGEAQPGVIRHWISQYWPLKSSDGTVFGITAIAHEITERWRLEESRQREQAFRSLAENSMDIIARFDSDLRWTYINPAIEAIVGRPRAEYLGKTHREMGSPEALDRPIMEVFASGEPRTAEATVSTPNGDRYVEARLVPEFGPDGQVKTVLTIARDLTHRKQIEDALHESEKKYRTLVENLHEGVWLIDDAARTTFVNAPMSQLLGYAPEEMVGEELFKFMDPQHVAAAKANLERGRTGARANYEFEFRRKDGEAVWTRIATAPLFDEQGEYQGALAGVIDITERKRADDELFRRGQEFEALAERSPDIIARVDRSLRLCYVNPAIERLTGRPREWFLDKTPRERELPPDEVITREQALRHVFDTGRELVIEHKNPSLTGERYFQARLVPELDPDNQVKSVLVVERDIDDLKRTQQALEELVLVDPLTGVANRRFLERFVGREWSREARHQLPVAAIMIDIDCFKAYNDHYGHGQGDACLRQVAATLRGALHRPADTLVRYGGEEFVVVLPECDLSAAREVAERLRQAVETCDLPHFGARKGERVTISLGVAAMNAHEGEFHDLLAAADAALYRAKEKGRNRVETSS